jgi:D-alanyl-D-alanine carboxypeptidase
MDELVDADATINNQCDGEISIRRWPSPSSAKTPNIIVTANDPQTLPAAVAAKSTELACVTKLMLSYLSGESTPAESGDNSIRSDDEHPDRSTNYHRWEEFFDHFDEFKS